MKPEEKAKQFEEERQEVEEHEKKPYSEPKLARHGVVEEFTGFAPVS